MKMTAKEKQVSDNIRNIVKQLNFDYCVVYTEGRKSVVRMKFWLS